MTVFHVATASVALSFGLLLTSALMAEQARAPEPYAQMNRAQYVKAGGVESSPCADSAAKTAPHAQMNRKLY